jgi:acetyl esterase/lipase
MIMIPGILSLSARLLLCVCLFSISLCAQEHRVVPLYAGVAPGSEGWTQEETQSPAPWNPSTRLIRNIVKPTLTLYLPKSNPSGIGIIVAPGGGFMFLSWKSEGTDVAHWLADHGIAAFVLKYRVENTGTEEEFQQRMKELFKPRASGSENPQPPADPERDKAMQLAGQDGLEAVRIIRQHAAEWNIAPDHIGFMGFSAGGMVTDHVALDYSPDTRPNFAAPIYGAPFTTVTVPTDAPPLFILCADDDPLVPSGLSARLYGAWKRAGKSAELHIYSRGGHGFGMDKHNLPVDHWIDLFYDWLGASGFLKPKQ